MYSFLNPSFTCFVNCRVEVSDQEDGVQWLTDNGLCDGRVGVYGWSYGGYMSASLLCRSSMFTAAVAGAPGACHGKRSAPVFSSHDLLLATH